MQVVFLVELPRYTRHPTLRPLFDMLQGTGHEPVWCTKEMLIDGAFPRPDVVLAKTDMEDPRVLDAAESLARQGTRVINTPQSWQMVEDRLKTDDLLERAGLPVPPRFVSLAEGQAVSRPHFRKPRSNYSHHIQMVASRADVTDGEHCYYQQEVPNDGILRKLYVIGRDVFLVTREGIHIADFERKHLEQRVLVDTPPRLAEFGRRVGEVTGLEVYGADVVGRGDALYIIDVNPFPGFHGVPRAPALLAGLITGRRRSIFPPQAQAARSSSSAAS
jgi:ribosomal protein S6--L-glutamate ligase